jgi:exodeoxyribonuclease VII large subunit
VDYTISDFVADLRAPTPSAAAEMVSGAREDLRVSLRSLQGRLAQAVRMGLERRRLLLERLSRNRAFAVAPNKIRDLQQRFDETTFRLNRAVLQYVADLKHRNQMLATRLGKVDMIRLIAHKKEILGNRRQNLISGIQSCLRAGRARLGLAAGKVDSLSPLAIMKRGFSLCRDQQGRVIKRSTDVAQGDPLRVTLASGELDCRVEAVRQSE